MLSNTFSFCFYKRVEKGFIQRTLNIFYPISAEIFFCWSILLLLCLVSMNEAKWQITRRDILFCFCFCCNNIQRITKKNIFLNRSLTTWSKLQKNKMTNSMKILSWILIFICCEKQEKKIFNCCYILWFKHWITSSWFCLIEYIFFIITLY